MSSTPRKIFRFSTHVPPGEQGFAQEEIREAFASAKEKGENPCAAAASHCAALRRRAMRERHPSDLPLQEVIVEI
jgi:hypothetical protein